MDSLFSNKMWWQYIFLGFLLGLTSFWNGVVAISGVLIISVLAVLWRQYLLLILPFTTTVVAQLLTWFFVGFDSPISPRIVIGFLAEERSFTGIIDYYLLLFGILPFLLLLVFLKISSQKRIWVVAFVSPFVFANIVQLSPLLAVNHKFINISVLLLNIFVAYVLALWLAGSKKLKVFAVICLILITASGVADFMAVWNASSRKSVHNPLHPVTVWIENNTNPNDTFLISSSIYSPVLWAGRKAFLGFYPFAKSAGYDTNERMKITKSIYRGKSYPYVQKLLIDNDIKYVVVERADVVSRRANKKFFDRKFSRVFFDKASQTSIYQSF